MLVAFGLISTYLELALKYLHVVQMGMVQLLCGTVPLVSKQWGLNNPSLSSVEAGPFTFSYPISYTKTPLVFINLDMYLGGAFAMHNFAIKSTTQTTCTVYVKSRHKWLSVGQ